MKKLFIAGMVVLGLSACNTRDNGLQIPTGSDVTVEKRDGVKVEGKLIEVKPDHVVVELRDGTKRNVSRGEIAKVNGATEQPKEQPKEAQPEPTTGAKPENGKGPNADASTAAADPAPVYREVTIPAGTVLKATLNTAVASDSSNPEDQVRATLKTPVTINGVQALPTGTALIGHVTDVARSAKVKGRARVAFRFSRVDPPKADSMQISSATIAREAEGTKKRDAATIGGGAVGGAIIGGIIGGGDGAAKGAAIGGAGGTGVVLATRGKEVRLAAGTPVSVKLTRPLTVRVPAH